MKKLVVALMSFLALLSLTNCNKETGWFDFEDSTYNAKLIYEMSALSSSSLDFKVEKKHNIIYINDQEINQVKFEKLSKNAWIEKSFSSIDDSSNTLEKNDALIGMKNVKYGYIIENPNIINGIPNIIYFIEYNSNLYMLFTNENQAVIRIYTLTK